MALLSNNWITEPLIDFEYKQYVLLDYIKKLKEDFQSNKIYPYFSDAKSKLHSLKNLIEIKKGLSQSEYNHIKILTGFDFNEFKLVYQKKIQEKEVLSEIEAIIEYALPIFNASCIQGENLKKEIEAKLQLIPIGILPIQNKEGYLFLNQLNQTRIYRYRYSLISNIDGNKRYQDIKTIYIASVSNSLSNTYENIKYSLIKENKDLPTPSVYLIETEINLPIIETILPLVKDKLIDIISD